MIQRNYYLDRLIRNMWNGEIKVITGICRCGKSVLLFELFDEYLRNHGTDATQIIKIELDQRRYYKYRNPITLCEYVEQLVLGQQDKKLYLFIDEVQLTAKVIDQENGGIEAHGKERGGDPALKLGGVADAPDAQTVSHV